MRIVHAANFVAPRSGGIRTMLRALALGYAEAGHEVVTVVPGRSSADERTGWGRQVTVASPPIPGSGGYRAILDRQTVRSVLEDLAPDRLEVSDRLTLRHLGPWARERGVPSVVFSHERLDALLRHYGGPVFPSRRVADRHNGRLAGSFDQVVCTTRWAAEEFTRLGATNLAHVPLGIDLDTFSPHRRDEALRMGLLQGAQVLVGAAVRLSPEKRPDLLVPALAALRSRGVDAHLVIAGDGPQRARMEKAAQGLPVTFLGFLRDRQELASVLASLDVAVAPGPYETFGLAALEALACGTPVVAPSSGALRELVVQGTGVTVGSTPEAVAAGIVEVLARGLREAGAPRLQAEKYPWSLTVQAMLDLHSGVPSQQQRQPGLQGQRQAGQAEVA